MDGLFARNWNCSSAGCRGRFGRRHDHHTICAKHAHQPGARKEVAPNPLMRKLFGTDGIRAVAGEAPLDPPTIFATGLALASTLKKGHPKPRVLLGSDTRESSPWIAAVIAAGLQSGGAEVMNAGGITSPGVAYLTRKHRFA